MRIQRPAKSLFLNLFLLLTALSFHLLVADTPAQEARPGPATRAATAQEPPPDEAPVAVFRPAGPDPASRPAVRLAAAIDQARADFRQRLHDLTSAYHAASEADRRRAIQREIDTLKQGVEITIMTIQRDHARDLGLDQEAEEIAARLALLADLGQSDPVPVDASGEGGDDHED